jgi:hypothetical protein
VFRSHYSTFGYTCCRVRIQLFHFCSLPTVNIYLFLWRPYVVRFLVPVVHYTCNYCVLTSIHTRRVAYSNHSYCSTYCKKSLSTKPITSPSITATPTIRRYTHPICSPRKIPPTKITSNVLKILKQLLSKRPLNRLKRSQLPTAVRVCWIPGFPMPWNPETHWPLSPLIPLAHSFTKLTFDSHLQYQCHERRCWMCYRKVLIGSPRHNSSGWQRVQQFYVATACRPCYSIMWYLLCGPLGIGMNFVNWVVLVEKVPALTSTLTRKPGGNECHAYTESAVAFITPPSCRSWSLSCWVVVDKYAVGSIYSSNYTFMILESRIPTNYELNS